MLFEDNGTDLYPLRTLGSLQTLHLRRVTGCFTRFSEKLEILFFHRKRRCTGNMPSAYVGKQNFIIFNIYRLIFAVWECHQLEPNPPGCMRRLVTR